MQHQRARRAASGVRAFHGTNALLTVYFGIDVCDSYIRDLIAQDLRDDPSVFEPDLPVIDLNPFPDRQMAESDTQSVERASDETMVDKNATKPLWVVGV